MHRPNGIAARAALGFALVSAITAAAVVGSALLARRSADERERILVTYADDLEHASQAQASAERMVARGRGYLLSGGPLEGVKSSEESLHATLARLDHDGASPAERSLLRAVEASAVRYGRLLNDILRTTTATEDRLTLAKTLRERLLPARAELDQGIESLVAEKRRRQDDARKEAERIGARAVWIAVALGAAALSLSALLATLFTRRLAEIHRREQASARRATEALDAREELLGIVAHDLRSPLTSILLRAGWIVKTCEDRIVQSSAISIQVTCDHMSKLIQSLLDAATIDDGRLSVLVEPCSAGQIVSDVLETFAPVAAESSVRLEPDVTPYDLKVWADRGRLTQVLSNLVANALRFTPEGGAVAVSACAAEGAVAFGVRDTGPGILPEHQPHVFERHWKLDRRHTGGVGLGLYIAKGVVEAHGGRIWIASTPGKGCSFQFEIPRPAGADDGRKAADTHASVPSRPQVESHVPATSSRHF